MLNMDTETGLGKLIWDSALMSIVRIGSLLNACKITRTIYLEIFN